MKNKAPLLFAFLFFLLFSVASSLLFLPYLVNTYIFPKIIENLPFSEKEIHLSSISPWKLSGTLSFSDSDQSILALPAIEFNFSPKSILNGRIDSILVEGGILHLNLDTVTPQKDAHIQQSYEKQQTDKTPILLPLVCDTLTIKNSTIVLTQNQKKHHFSIDGTLTANFRDHESGRKQFSSATAKIDITGAGLLSSTLNFQPEKQGHELKFTLSAPDVSQVACFFPKLKKNNIQGLLALSGRLEVEDLARITNMQVTAEISGFSSTLKNMVLSSNSPSRPLTIMLKGDRKRVVSKITNLFIGSPFDSPVQLQGEYNLTNKKLTGKGQVTHKITQTPIEFSFSGDKTISGTNLYFTATTNSFSPEGISAQFFSPLKVQGNVNISEGKLFGKLAGTIARVTLPSQEIELKNLSFSIPIRFPVVSDNNAAGTFSVGQVLYRETPSGAAQGTINLKSEGADFSALFSSKFGPDILVKCSGVLALNGQSKVDCQLPETTINSASFPPFLVIPPEFSIDGRLAAQASFSSSPKNSKGSLHLQLKNTTINISDNRLSSINMAITFPDLPLLHSSPNQLCTIESIQFGKINLTEAKIHFHLENYRSLFIEKSKFTWCSGKVESGGFRISSAEQKLETTLYCDRLDFTQLLSQFGIEDTEGDGSLNGKLPMVLSKTGIRFDDGFLFSTPGNTGIIHFNNTDQLRQAIGNIDQAPYLDYSMKALNNFSYNWTKLTFNSQENDLLIKMQIDGKPASPLPFGYKKGRIVQSRKGPGLQHPIRLDINFRLPLTDLFQYGKNMQSFMENM